jgi:hypothetical protein
MPRAVWVAVVWVAAGVAIPAVAQPPAGPLAPVGGPPSSSALPFNPLLPGAAPSTQSLPSTPAKARFAPDRPPPVLGAPVGPARPSPEPAPQPIAFADPPADRDPPRGAVLGPPSAAAKFGAPAPATPAAPVPAAVVDAAVARTAYTPPEVDPVGEFLNRRAEPPEREKPPGDRPKLGAKKFSDWGEKLEGMIGHQNGGWFRSDHLFDGFISPVSNPFLFEDPRSLTEVRPIFIYQKIPSSQPDFFGGNVTFFGAQGRVAITDRWSFVFHKFGGISLDPGSGSPYGSETSFAELWLGPKFTFWRSEETCSLAAGGLQFQIPTGSRGAFQDTGSLSLVPYVTYGQNFLRDFQYGSFNTLLATGYAFSTTKGRSDYYWLSGHLDFDVLNLHRFYPLVELNWFLNTTNGNSTPIGSEGRDLINFGGQAKGTGLLTGAFGGRVKLTESAQFGAAFEIPIAGKRDLFRYRFTVDFILRY